MCGHLSDDSCASFLSIVHSSRPLALSPQLGQRINGLTVSFIGIYVLYCTVYNLCLFQKGHVSDIGISAIKLVTQLMDQLRLKANQLGRLKTLWFMGC